MAAVLGVALIILGVALFIRYSNPWYFCVSVTGFLFLAGGIFFAVILHMQQPPEQLQRLQSEIEADGEFIGKAAPGEVITWKAAPGRHHLVVADESQNAASRSVTVEQVP